MPGEYQYSLFREDDIRSVAMVPADFVDLDEAVRKANEAIDGVHLEIERDGVHPLVIPITLTYPFSGDLTMESTSTEWFPLRTAAGKLADMPGLGTLIDPILSAFVVYKTSSPLSTVVYKTQSGPNGLTRGDLGRVPVTMPWEPPARPPATGRRTVVALLDTAVEPHRWLGEPDADLGGEGFWVDARRMGWNPGPRLPRPPARGGAFARALAEYEGHGTFNAGLIRQVAPAAQVLAVHTIADDGQVHGDHVLNALSWLTGHLQAGDVVCLPFGWRPELNADRRFLALLAEVLGKLADQRILAVAAAGNDGSEEPIYPAAFAASGGTPADYRIRSVGALNVDHDPTPAFYSNGGEWVTAWEVGTSLVSAFPAVNAGAAPEYDGRGRRSADPDDFSSGTARWSGTSFAATVHAAKAANGKI